MKLSIQTEHLNNTLANILSVVDRKNTRPILTCCLFTAEESGLVRLEATDLEVSARITCEAEVSEGGKFCINPKNIFDLTREMPNRLLQLEAAQDNQMLKLSCGQINASFMVSSYEEFPTLTFSSSGESFELKGKDALYFINKTSHAISQDETRIFLNGIFLQQMGDKLRAVATNGYTFALIELGKMTPSQDELSKGIIVPRKGVSELKKLAEQDRESILKISVGESFMYVNSGDRHQISIRLIARDYPPYEAVIPSETSHSMTVSRSHLLDAIKRIKVLANEKSNAIRFSVDQEKLTVSANHPSLGEATEKIDIEYSGKSMDIGFNARYMMDSLSVLDDDDVTFEFNNELGPVIVKSNKLQEFLGIVMPLKL